MTCGAGVSIASEKRLLLTTWKSVLECQGVLKINVAVIRSPSERRYGCPDVTVGVCWES